MEKRLNLQFIKKGRLKTGDIFAMRLPDDFFLFGRVIDSQFPMMGGLVAFLYIYDLRSEKPEIDFSVLTPDRLLIPPVITFHNIWSQGYTLKIGNTSIRQEDLVKRHSFRLTEKKYVDEYGNEITKPKPGEICGVWAITGIGSLDDQLSDALNIKRAPLKEEDMYHVAGMTGKKIIHKKSDTELRKYSNYEWIIKNHPEIIE